MFKKQYDYPPATMSLLQYTFVNFKVCTKIFFNVYKCILHKNVENTSRIQPYAVPIDFVIIIKIWINTKCYIVVFL